ASPTRSPRQADQMNSEQRGGSAPFSFLYLGEGLKREWLTAPKSSPHPSPDGRERWRHVFKFLFIVVFCASCGCLANAQTSIGDYRRNHERQILDEFTRLLSIPNIASDTPNIRRNAEFIRDMMHRRGLSPRLLEGKSADTPPAV